MKKFIFAIGLFFLTFNSSNAQWFCKKKKPIANPPVATEQPKSKLESIESKTKNCVKFSGLFNLYKDTTNGQLFISFNKNQLGMEFIHFTYTENGVVDAGHHRGSYRGSRIFKIRKSFGFIELEQQNTNFYFDPNNPISKSANANISAAPLAYEKIIAEDKKTGDYLIDADELFLTEKLHQVKPTPRPGEGFKLGNLAKGKTQYISVRNYPENADILVRYVYDNPAPAADGGDDVTDAHSVAIELQHSFIAVPKNNFKARPDDARVGYFNEQVNDMTSMGTTNYKDIIHRWNLQKKDPSLAQSEPVKPIVWWIENTTPKSIRPIIKHAALQWNKAFEPLGFINAIQIFEQPDTAKWDAGDIRYNVLRWTSSPHPPFGGYGPSFVNPRTGEILGADIMLEYVFLTNRVKLEELYKPDGMHQSCDAGLYLHHQTQVAKSILEINNNDSTEISRLLNESIHYLILHEMGHTLGLMHNMKASQLHNPSELLDRELTSKTGLIGSVMDYPAVNLPPLGFTGKVQFCQNQPGPYDMWAIDYGYSLALEDEKSEQERLNKIASRSVEHALAFGNDADDMRAAGKGIDPQVMINDLSSDAITFSKQRILVAQDMIMKLNVSSIKSNEQSYQSLVNTFNSLSGAYATNVDIVSRYIGGVLVTRTALGQKDALDVPLRAVSYSDQKKAMDVLSKYAFAPNSMEIPEDLAKYLQTQRRGFGFFSNTEDPKLHNRVLRMQAQVLNHLTSQSVLLRLSDSRYLGNLYSPLEMLTDLTNACFLDDVNKGVNAHRRLLQTMYTEKLLSMIVGGYDPIAKAAVFAQLKKIQTICKSNTTDLETLTHRQYLAHIIEEGLDH